MIRSLANFAARSFLALSLAAALALASLPGPGAPPAFATVNTQASSTVVSGNGSQTAFTFGFIGVGTAYISVLYTSPTGVQTQLVEGPGATQYQVSLNAAVAGATWGIGGTVTYNPSGTPIPLGSTLTIYRSLPLLQGVSMSNQGNLAQLGKSAEQASDQVDMQLQQVNNLISRAIVANAANPFPPLPLPPAAQIANQGLCADSTGNNIVGCAGFPAGIVSTAMQPVVDAATLGLGRTAFGLGGMAVENIGLGLQDNGSGAAQVYFQTVADATSQSVTSAFHMTQRAAGAAITYTLPLASTLFNGFGFWVYADGGTVTFSPNASDNFQGQASGAAVSILSGYVAFVTTNAATPGVWYINVNPGASNYYIGAPQGRLTLVATSGGVNTPVMNAAETAETSVCYTPFRGDQMPIWYGASFIPTVFSEYCQALSSATLSPAAAAAGSFYDEFAWNDNGSIVVTRGPAWTNSTTRGYTLTRVGGFLTNTSAITNGPAAGYGLWVGSIMTDAGGATVTFNPTPAAASGGPSAGAWIGLWNAFNRVEVDAAAQDSKASWTYSTNTWRSSDNSVNNRITFIVGAVEDTVLAEFGVYASGAGGGTTAAAGVGLNSTSAPSGPAWPVVVYAAATIPASPIGRYDGYPAFGQNYLQALEDAPAASTLTWEGVVNSVQAHQISALLKY
jgi:hypothetical protein